MIFPGLFFSFISAACCFVAVSGRPRAEKKGRGIVLILLPSVILFPIISFFFLRGVIREWPHLSVFSVATVASIVAAAAAAVVLIPKIAA